MVLGLLLFCGNFDSSKNHYKNHYIDPKICRTGCYFLPGFFCLCLFPFDGFTEDITCPSHTCLIGVGVHSQGDGFVGVTQNFRHAGNICTVCDCYASEAVPQFVRVQLLYAIPGSEFLHIPCRALRVHRLCCAFLCEYIRAEFYHAFICPELLQQTHNFRSYIDVANLAIFGSVQIHTFFRSIAQVKHGLEQYAVGDCLSFFAEPYRYINTGSGKQIDFGLRMIK